MQLVAQGSVLHPQKGAMGPFPPQGSHRGTLVAPGNGSLFMIVQCHRSDVLPAFKQDWGLLKQE